MLTAQLEAGVRRSVVENRVGRGKLSRWTIRWTIWKRRMHGVRRIWSLVALLALCPLLNSCAFLPARRPLGPTAVPPSPTPPPPPLIAMGGVSTAAVSGNFYTPSGGWRVLWRVDCGTFTRRHPRGQWQVLMDVAQVRQRARPHEQQIVSMSATPGDASRQNGSTEMSIRGYVHLDVRVSRGCSWSVQALRDG